MLGQLFFSWVRKGRYLSLGVGAQKKVSQRVEVRVKTSHRPLQRIGLNGDHLGLVADIAGYLGSDKLVERADDACGSWGSREDCIFRDLGYFSSNHRGAASSIHGFVKHSFSACFLRETGGIVDLAAVSVIFELCYDLRQLLAGKEVDIGRGI